MPQGLCIPSLLAFSRSALRAALARLARAGRLNGLALVDGTCGNGRDTLFLAECLSSFAQEGAACQVLAFDVQPAALAAARTLLGPALSARVSFLLAGHEDLSEILAAEGAFQNISGLAAAVYNLGFLPGSDKRVTTKARSTLASLEQAAAALVPGGLLAAHAYGGHAGGLEELSAVETWFAGLPHKVWLATRYAQCNKTRNPEALFLAEKRPAA